MAASRPFWRNNGLTIVLLLLFCGAFAGQIVTGHRQYDDDQAEHGQSPATLVQYLSTPAFLEATMENWESEWLQMGLYVFLTVFLFQKGSSESKDPDKTAPVDRPPDPNRPGAPAPVRRGGLASTLYQHSLSMTFLGLFLVAFVLHAVGGAGEYNADQAEHGQSERVTVVQYMASSRFWFESFQNWQSEFLSVAAMVVLTIFLREHGSPESKPVDAAHGDTGND
jgi:hypothetical protein